MSSRLLFVFVVTMLVSTVFAGRCYYELRLNGNGEAAIEKTCAYNTCVKGSGSAGGASFYIKECGGGPACDQSSQTFEMNGIQGTAYCCEGDLCNSSKSSSIAAVALLSLFIL